MNKAEIEEKVDAIAEKMDADIIACFGRISLSSYRALVNEFVGRPLRKNVLFFLTTLGGDPDAGYKIARHLQELYNTLRDSGKNIDPTKGDLIVLIDGMCKSAGTLICLGANKIVMSGTAELGPIDMQLLKQDEVGERTSGLTPIQAVQFLEMRSVGLFLRHFANLRFSEEMNFSTRMAADIATKLTIGLLAPIYEQIDPIRLAEVHRSVSIAAEYGKRLSNGNLEEDALERLLMSYPSHGFVIDKREANKLFKCVDSPSLELEEVIAYFRQSSDQSIEKGEGFIGFLSSPPELNQGASIKREHELNVQ